MAQIGILTTMEKDSLLGQTFAPDSFFNPIQDINDDWVISEVEVTQNTNLSFPWVNNLTLSTYLPKAPNGL